jgi:hypothetical protein
MRRSLHANLILGTLFMLAGCYSGTHTGQSTRVETIIPDQHLTHCEYYYGQPDTGGTAWKVFKDGTPCPRVTELQAYPPIIEGPP